VLGLLLHRERSGYDLRRAAERSVGYLWTPARSQIYAILPGLVRAGLATRRDVAQETRPDKQLYRITERGTKALRAWLASEPEPDTVRSGFMLRIFFADALPHEDVIALIEARRQTLQAHLDRLLEIEREAKAEIDPADFFPLLTLRSGLLRVRAALEWCEEAVRAVEEHHARKERT
jgi:DNA-binding PadR family transcriptional regulator